MFNWIKRFKFDSATQERGYLAFLAWARARHLSEKVRPIDLFFIQKDHESNEYWRETMSSQLSQLRQEIVETRVRLAKAEVEIQRLLIKTELDRLTRKPQV